MKIIGMVDKADFPELGLYGISCKTDTGAETSSIHCSRVKLIEVDGVDKLKVKLLDPKHPDYEDKEFVFDKFFEKNVKSSNGIAETRFVIESKIVLFGEPYDVELTLADRGEMRFPVLLGRKFLCKKLGAEFLCFSA